MSENQNIIKHKYKVGDTVYYCLFLYQGVVHKKSGHLKEGRLPSVPFVVARAKISHIRVFSNSILYFLDCDSERIKDYFCYPRGSEVFDFFTDFSKPVAFSEDKIFSSVKEAFDRLKQAAIKKLNFELTKLEESIFLDFDFVDEWEAETFCGPRRIFGDQLKDEHTTRCALSPANKKANRVKKSWLTSLLFGRGKFIKAETD